jgi:hypothetical protein
VQRVWFTMMVMLLVVCLGLGVVRALPESYMLRFSDTPYLHQSASQSHLTFQLRALSPDIDSTEEPAYKWLKRSGWKQVWPLLSSASRELLQFAGPSVQRYLRISTDGNYYIWGRPLEVDPHQLPFLEISWGVERFPNEAALDIRGRNDRPIVVLVSFGPKVPSGGILPDVPRALAFFWGETETVGNIYTCVTPRNGHADQRLQCKFPQVKYIALRRGDAGSVHTDRVNLLEYFQRYFPEYWQEHRRVPPIVGVSFEAGSKKTDSASSARLYALVFTTTQGSSNGHMPVPAPQGN